MGDSSDGGPFKELAGIVAGILGGSEPDKRSYWNELVNAANLWTTTDSTASLKPLSNELHTAAAHEQRADRSFALQWGKITYAAPYINWYKVKIDGFNGERGCTVLTQTSVMPFSVRPTSPITPGTHVLVWISPWVDTAYIIGCLPPQISNGSIVYPDYISAGSGVGYKQDFYYGKALTSLFAETSEGRYAHGAKDFSHSRPLDSLSIGEWGQFNDLGGGFFADMLMTFMRIDESCGVWGFYMDRLLRVSGHNYDWQTAFDEMRRREDSGEAHGFRGVAAYAWEALGAYSHGEAVHEVADELDVQYNKAIANFEAKDGYPISSTQQPFYRYEEYEGYMGQGYMRHMALPPAASGLRRYSAPEVLQGVFREHIGLDGGYSLASAHSVAIMKRSLIPIPKQLLLPEDPIGDDLAADSGYKFAGRFGSGPDHAIEGLPSPGTDVPHLLSAAAALDSMAYIYNWKALHPFHYHVKDYFLPEEGEAGGSEQSPTKLQWIPPYSELRSSNWLSSPTAKTARVDHRYSADYFETQAGVFITPEGGVVIRDAWGSEIRMVGGGIQISAAGDVYTQTGGSIVNYAGDDAIIRARQSVDITATNKDVRLKAQQHCEAVAGVGGTGRLLLHCQAAAASHQPKGKFGEEVPQSGLILKGDNCELIGLAREIYLRTGGGDIQPGDITIESGRQLNVLATQENHYLQWAANFTFPLATRKQKTYHFGLYECAIPVQTEISDRLYIHKNGIWSRGGVLVVNGDIRSDRNPGGMILQHRQGDESWDVVDAELLESIERVGDFVIAADTRYKTDIDANLKAENRPGNDDVIRYTQFAPRTEEQMATENWVLPETFWQQLARESEQTVGTWEENSIPYQGQEMYPHPGKNRWASDAAWYQSELSLHDAETNCDVPRGSGDSAGSPYDNPNLNVWRKTVADKAYLVIER